MADITSRLKRNLSGNKKKERKLREMAEIASPAVSAYAVPQPPGIRQSEADFLLDETASINWHCIIKTRFVSV